MFYNKTNKKSEWNEIDFGVHETKRFIGLKVHEVGVTPANRLEWWSAVASVR